MRIVVAEAVGGRIRAQDADGRIYFIWIDDDGKPHAGASCSSIANDGYVVDYLMPGNGGPLVLPIDIRVSRMDGKPL